MSNTTKRILSAVIIIALVALVIWLGKIATLAFVLFVGILCLDELFLNFLKLSRKSFPYLYSVISFSFVFITLNLLSVHLSLWFFNVLSLLMNGLLIYYLFCVPIESEFAKKFFLNSPILISFLPSLPLLSIGLIFLRADWIQILAIILVVNSSMDIGAWLVGKNFGKHKLWPKVSPKKTIEGLIGGMIFATATGMISYYIFYGNIGWFCSVIFAAAGLLSQVGDLVQSKIKREFRLKDSSHIIPGHGGVYDRIDSLIFLAPFFHLFLHLL